MTGDQGITLRGPFPISRVHTSKLSPNLSVSLCIFHWIPPISYAIDPLIVQRSMASTVARYESFLINNVSTISTLESSLRSLTWFLPGRFKDADLASEACQSCTAIIRGAQLTVKLDFLTLVSASLNVMSMYHDTLLAKVISHDPKYRPLIPPSLHTRYTRAWSNKSAQYKWAARALELIRFTGLVIEMGLHRKVSIQTRWKGVVLLEAIKSISHL